MVVLDNDVFVAVVVFGVVAVAVLAYCFGWFLLDVLVVNIVVVVFNFVVVHISFGCDQ